MDSLTIILLLIETAFVVPLIIIGVQRKFLSRGFEISIAYAKMLGFLISINGSIRRGKTSFQSGLSHIFQIILQQEIEDYILEVQKIYAFIDFNELDQMILNAFQELESSSEFETKHVEASENILKFLDKKYNLDLEKTLVYNFYSSKTSLKYLTDYIYSFYVLNLRRNYVQSKTKFYSHITGNVSYKYDVKHQKIHTAFNEKDYSIYDYMIELVDEASDEIGASKRYEDVKEEDGDKDYRRKFGQIHQERNRIITTKQDVKDEIKKFRTLTQSNIYLPFKVEQRGQNKWIYNIIEFIYNVKFFFYKLFIVWLPFRLAKLFTHLDDDYEEYQQAQWRSINYRRKQYNKLLHISWYLKSIGYNKYEIWDYPDENDVKKSNKEYFNRMIFYIPIKYCFGTYDTHHWKNIQRELLEHTKTESCEDNWFINMPYFEQSSEGVDREHEIGF